MNIARRDTEMIIHSVESEEEEKYARQKKLRHIQVLHEIYFPHTS